MIIANELRKHFGQVRAVDGISFTAPDGMITGLLGPNGSGKTTTMRMLYTLLKPDNGSVSIDGLDAIACPQEVRRRIGVLPDSKGLYKHLTAQENIAYFAALHGIQGAALERRVEAMVEELGMADFARRRTDGFSQGQRVKVALARALVHDPTHVMLDEPTNGLDVMSTRMVRTYLRGLRARGRCILFSSHIMQEVAALCDSIIIIAEGKVVAAGSADYLIEKAGRETLEDAFVALIGSGEGLAS